MPDPNLFRLNNVPYSWTSCSHFFNGLPYKGLTKCDFDESRERTLVHAAQQDGTPIGLTAGIYKVESVTFTMLRSSATALLLDLTALGAGSFGDASFVYMCQTFEPVIPPMPPTQTTILGLQISKVKDTQEVGSEALLTEFTCQAIGVVRTVGGVPMKLWSTIRGLL